MELQRDFPSSFPRTGEEGDTPVKLPPSKHPAGMRVSHGNTLPHQKEKKKKILKKKFTHQLYPVMLSCAEAIGTRHPRLPQDALGRPQERAGLVACSPATAGTGKEQLCQPSRPLDIGRAQGICHQTGLFPQHREKKNPTNNKTPMHQHRKLPIPASHTHPPPPPINHWWGGDERQLGERIVVGEKVLAAPPGIPGTGLGLDLPFPHRVPGGESWAASLPQPALLFTCRKAAHQPVLRILLFGQISYPSSAHSLLF